jgi:hypothetical protein
MCQPIPNHQLWLLAENRPTSSGETYSLNHFFRGQDLGLIYVVFKLQKQVDFFALRKSMGIFLQFYTKPHVCGESHGQKKKRERNFYHL